MAIDRPTRLFRRGTMLAVAGALGVLAAGAGLGAGLYAALAPGSTTTTVVRESAASATPVSTPSGGGTSVEAVYDRTHEGVVDITVDANTSTQLGGAPFGFGGTQESQAEGSGWVYDTKGDIVTNEHVVTGATKITVKLWNGSHYPGHLVGSDVGTDLAVVRISAPRSDLHPLGLGNSDEVAVGDPVVAIGSPFGLPETVTSGIVSALHRSIDSPNDTTIGNTIQTDAPINHGNSGGPLLDSAGDVIGVNAQIQSQSGGSDGVGFAIPSNTVRSVVSQIVSGKTVAHAYLGVRVEDATSPPGAGITQVLAGTPAATAGLKPGDIVTALDGKPVTSQSDLSAVIQGKRPGDSLKITYLTGGSTTENVTVKLTARPPS